MEQNREPCPDPHRCAPLILRKLQSSSMEKGPPIQKLRQSNWTPIGIKRNFYVGVTLYTSQYRSVRSWT